MRAVLKQRGIAFDEDAPEVLVGGGKTLFERLGSLTRGLVIKPLKKMFRSVLFWLTARNAARTAMVTYLMARFLHHPRLVGEGEVLTVERARFLGQVFLEVSRGVDVRAAKGAFRKLVKLSGQREKASGEEVSETIEQAAPGFVAEFDSMVNERLG